MNKSNFQIISPRPNEVFQHGLRDWSIPILVKYQQYTPSIQIRIKKDGETIVEKILRTIGGPSKYQQNWIQKLKERQQRYAYTELNITEPGYYTLELSIVMDAKENLIQSITFGIGEVFICCGQSNSANSGQVHTTTNYRAYMASGNYTQWIPLKDPFPTATNTGGSPWPSMVTELGKTLTCPIGVVSVGKGGSSVLEWQPEAEQFFRMVNAFEFLGKRPIRAILWHQGETDGSNGMSTQEYKNALLRLISETERISGLRSSWIIAQAAFLPDTPKENLTKIIQAQQEITENASIEAGPTTEDLTGDEWRHDGVHFNKKGLEEHGKRWARVLQNLFQLGVPEEK